MARITVEDCLTRENNRFALVLLAAKRTKQILRGSKVTLEDTRDNKSVVTALREIAKGDVRFKTEEDLEQERQKALLEREQQEREAKAREIQLAASQSIMPSPVGGGAHLSQPLPTLADSAEETVAAPAEEAAAAPAEEAAVAAPVEEAPAAAEEPQASEAATPPAAEASTEENSAEAEEKKATGEGDAVANPQ